MNCGKCSEQFDRDKYAPRILPQCGHSFCEICIRELLDLADNENFIHCAECGTLNQGNSVENFPINQALIMVNAANMTQQINIQELKIMNESQTLTESSQDLLKCQKHLKSIEAFCNTDRKPLCIECILEGHSKHDLCSVAQAADRERNRLGNTLQALSTLNSQIQQTLTAIQNSIEQTKSACYKSKDEITGMFQSLYTILRSREQALLKILDQTFYKEEEILLSKERQVKKQLAAVISLQKDLQWISEEADIDLMLKSQERDELVKIAATKLPTVINSLKIFQNFNKENEINQL